MESIHLSVFLLACSFCVMRVGSFGVNWGTEISHPLPAQMMVNLLKSNGVDKVKLFSPDTNVLRALAHSGIEVMVGVPNSLLVAMADAAQANLWVQNNVVRFRMSGTDIRYVAVGDETFNGGPNGVYSASIRPALSNILHALNRAELGDQVKATVPMNAGDLLDGSLPSNAAFKEDIAQEAAQIAALLAQNGCPFTININPFLSLYNNKSYSVDGIFFDSHALPVEDGAFVYHNVFDISYDSLDVVLENAGYTNMEIIVGAIGWPTDGDIHANSSNAQRFNQGFLDHAANGTPRRPNRRIEFYMLSLIDEDMKGISQGNFQRHWGLFRYDGKPKYPLSLSANAEKLSAAVGVQYLPQQWCVLDTTIVDTSTLPGSITYACNNADCTALDYGGSCNGYLNDTGNASYAFNAYYQMQNQDVGACSFNGLGHIITDNPSNGSCEFIIQLAYDSSATSKQKFSALAVALMVFLVVL